MKFLKTLPFFSVMFTVWIVNHKIPNATVTGKYFWFYGAMISVSAAVFIYALFERKAYRFALQDALVTLFCLLGLAVTWFHNNAVSNKWVILLLMLPLYFCFRYVLQDNKRGKDFLLFFLLITGLVEAVWGLAQLHGFCGSHHHLYKVTGSFFNPGPYGGYLALVLPVAVYFYFSAYYVFKRKWNQRYLLFYIRFGLSVLTVVCIAIILPSTLSRAAWIAVVGGCLFVLFQVFLRRSHKFSSCLKLKVSIFSPSVAIRIAIVMVLAVVLFAGAYYFKKESADGRWLIWKVSARVITQHPFGVGLGNFAGNYGEQQAAYFASGAGSAQEHRVAGTPEYGFNEYVQICVECGIVGLLLFFAILCRALYSGIKSKHYAAVASLVALLIFASMSYPFNVLPFLIVLVFLLAVCATETTKLSKKSDKFVSIALFGVLMLVTFAGSYSRIHTYRAYKEWNDVNMLINADLRSDAITLCDNIYPELKQEIRFVYQYANLLKDNGQYAESNQILQQGMKISCDPVLYNLAGTNYQMLKDYATAESYFMKAANMVPNRLFPYYLLAKLYTEMGLHDQAFEMAKIVQTKEPKVHSQAVSEMREEMKKYAPNQMRIENEEFEVYFKNHR